MNTNDPDVGQAITGIIVLFFSFSDRVHDIDNSRASHTHFLSPSFTGSPTPRKILCFFPALVITILR